MVQTVAGVIFHGFSASGRTGVKTQIVDFAPGATTP
jgi:hypothetical protein